MELDEFSHRTACLESRDQVGARMVSLLLLTPMASCGEDPLNEYGYLVVSAQKGLHPLPSLPPPSCGHLQTTWSDPRGTCWRSEPSQSECLWIQMVSLGWANLFQALASPILVSSSRARDISLQKVESCVVNPIMKVSSSSCFIVRITQNLFQHPQPHVFVNLYI